MINPKNIYIRQITEAVRSECIKENLVNKSTYPIDEATARKIIKYFKGTLECFSDEKLKDEHPAARGNSFLKKINDEGNFLIGYINFKPMDIFHELGHAVLELEGMKIGDYRSCGDTNAGIFEILASKFSRFFLMPTDLFAEKVVEYTYNGKCDIEKVAKFFNVDYSQVVSHGRESSFWE